MYPDKEINALSQAYEAIKELDRRAVKRILDWVTDKLGLLDEEIEIEETSLQEDQSIETEVPFLSANESSEILIELEKKKRGRKPKLQIESKDSALSETDVEDKDDFNYNSLKDMLAASKIKKNPSKILLTAVYLQEKKNLKELTSNDISSDLKKLKIIIKNPSQIINSLMLKKKPLLTLIGERGISKQSRKKFRVTEEGLKVAKSYLN